MGDAKLLDVVTAGKVRRHTVNRTDVMANVVPDNIGQVVGDEAVDIVEPEVVENAEDADALQFSRSLIPCHMNGRCHGQHIPADIRLGDRDWERGDRVVFRTEEGIWNINIVLNHGSARFSGGWSRFVKDNNLNLHDNLRFTLREEANTAVFDVEVNPVD